MENIKYLNCECSVHLYILYICSRISKPNTCSCQMYQFIMLLQRINIYLYVYVEVNWADGSRNVETVVSKATHNYK